MTPISNSVPGEDDRPLISVILPAYNAAKYINRSINSVMAQTYSKWELLIIDDGSTDDLTEVLKPFKEDKRIHYYHQKNSGPASARNRGLKEARGTLITFLDADDEYPNDKLMNQWQYLNQHHEMDFVSGKIQYQGEEDLTKDFLFEDQEEQTMKNVHLGAMLCRKSVFEAVGDFDETMRHAEDVDWWMRCLERGISYTFLPQISLRYHRHQNNMTLDQNENTQFFLKALHQSIRRRRTAQTPKIPNLIQEQIQPGFEGHPEVTILVWWTSDEQIPLEDVLKQEFRAFELILLFQENQQITVPEELDTYQHISLSAQSFEEALALGFESARGEFLTVLAPKVRWVSKKLNLQLDFLKHQEKLASCTCMVSEQASADQLGAIEIPTDNYSRLYRCSAFQDGQQFAQDFTDGDPTAHVLTKVLEYHIRPTGQA